MAIKELIIQETENVSMIGEKFTDFSHEVSVMSELDHPNIVKLYGITTSPQLR